MKTILKRVVNAIVTIPILLCFFFICAFVFCLVNQCLLDLDASKVEGFVKFLKVSLGIIIATFAVFGMIGSSYFFFVVLATGDGIIWRKVKKYNYLIDKKGGEVVHIFNKSELIWRFDQMFSENTLCENQVLK